MSRTYISQSLRKAVIERANGRCEYCGISQNDTFLPHQPDHIIAEQHRGKTEAENLALACFDCNKAKGPNIASIDPESGEIVRLFNPRRDKWDNHFRYQSNFIIGNSPIGRATVELLLFNHSDRLIIRSQV